MTPSCLMSHTLAPRRPGPAALGALQASFTNDLGRIEPVRPSTPTSLIQDDGSVLDDIIVWWVDEERFDVMPNASNTDRVATALRAADDPPAMEDVTATRVLAAGPQRSHEARAVVSDAAAVGRFRVAPVVIGGAETLVAGTGYTGEDGLEIAVPVEQAAAVWASIVGAGITPAGLGARDTLRLEAGLPLHGHELGPGITPAQAGLSWVVRFDKGEFRGRAAPVLAEAGVPKRLHGLVVDGRRPPREGQTVLLDGEAIGTISSGNFSPVREQGIALAFLDRELSDGTAVGIDVRGKELPATVQGPPFVG